MDKSKEYINMCFKSKELQSYKKKKKKDGTYGYWNNGDYYVSDQDSVVFMSEGENELDNEIWEEDIWLPNIEQLKMLVGSNSVTRMLNGEKDEQKLLGMVMNIRFNKVWHEDNWKDKYEVEVTKKTLSKDGLEELIENTERYLHKFGLDKANRPPDFSSSDILVQKIKALPKKKKTF